MVRFAIDVPDRVYGFLEAAFRFAWIFDGDRNIESHIQEYIVKTLIATLVVNPQDTSGSLIAES